MLTTQDFEVLLDLNNQLAAARDKDALFEAVVKKLKPIFKFEVAIVALLEKDRKHLRLFLKHLLPEILQNELFKQFSHQRIPIENIPFDRIASIERPEVFKVQEILQQYPALLNKFPLKLMSTFSAKCGLMGKLRYGGEVIGFMNMGSRQDGAFENANIELYQHALDIVAAAVSNAAAFEEIESLRKQLERENSYLIDEINMSANFGDVVGQSAAVRRVLSQVGKVAPTDTTVLVQGETGTGKELIARALHNLSTRAQKPLVKVNCAALPAQLIESELFGHEKGSFTGATDRRIGKFELANGGTIFLDEIGELPLDLQAKLLRVLQEKEIERIGGKETLKLDVRVIAATNRELEREIDAGKFRRDLFFRLSVFPITLPPLRERREDVPILVMHFVEKYSKKIGRRIERIEDSTMSDLMRYDWHGNIRELENVIERAVILSQSATLRIDGLLKPSSELTPAEQDLPTLEELERKHILDVLRRTNGKVSGTGGAAEILGLKPTTLESRMKKLGIERKRVFATQSD